jgi:hypothetical protein
MNRDERDKILMGESSEIIEAHKSIIELQKDKSGVLKVGVPHLDSFLVGGLNNRMVFILSRPSMGKSHSCESIISNLLNPEINFNQDIKILRMNLEMGAQQMLMRDLRKALNKKMSDIIKDSYTEEEKAIVRQVVAKHQDKRVINFSKAVTGEDLKYVLRKFIDSSDKNTKRIVLLDHLSIYLDKKTIDEVLTICNEFKLEDKNLSFIFYAQLGRTVEDLWRNGKDTKVNPRNMLPNSSHVLSTDTMFQYADIVMTMIIPQVVDCEEFAAVHKERNAHLKEHFIEGNNDDNTFVRLKGRNRIYYSYIKIRMVDDFEDPRLYCDILDPKYEDTVDKLYKESKQSSISLPPIPVFKKPELPAIEFTPPPPLGTLADAFGPPVVDDEDNAPF